MRPVHPVAPAEVGDYSYHPNSSLALTVVMSWAAVLPCLPPRPQVQKLHDHYIAEVEKLKKVKDTELREHRD